MEHSAELLTCIRIPYGFQAFVLSIFEWPLKTGFTVLLFCTDLFVLKLNVPVNNLSFMSGHLLG